MADRSKARSDDSAENVQEEDEDDLRDHSDPSVGKNPVRHEYIGLAVHIQVICD